ncbi:FAD/NAD(P)-binding domain-containing protein [Rhizoclosmatium globosum]|uniref:FAD/NAD(P)-binding domain-containing protein n=1 Tax=Rhizoclosmatium globosum TaxID=329046 RepID=A0A1Y2BUC5_9FUNG|nr:FAD/NAD(P)-binding domain-containing protein [Rhizoclosmatium globosum]|eukprot:ORY38237.1 FAD/NAD(P)-binding domain-containing protein [Rhizoclosmatium globosum]
MPSVVIIGSGLVGAATALALHQVGIKSSLYDQIDPIEAVSQGQAIEFGESGGAVMIQAGGLRVLRTLGLLDECIAAGILTPYVSWHKIDGSAPIVHDARISNRTSGEMDPQLQTPLQILRSDLHRILIQSCHRAGIKTFVSKKLVDVTQDDVSATATFTDGSTATGDLIIGADGIHSVTRRKVFGENLRAKFTGSTGHIGVVKTTENGITLKPEEGTAFYVDRDKKLFMATFKVSDDTAAVSVSTFNDPENEDQSYRPVSDLPKHASLLADMLHTWNAPPHIEKMMRYAFRLSSTSIYDLPDMSSYHKGRVILIGDAAHGMVPSAGIGLLTGLEDVGTLLALFRHFPQEENWNKALELYSKIRVERGTAAANRSRFIKGQTYATTPIFGGSVNHFIQRMVVAGFNSGRSEVAKLVKESN